MKRLDKLERSKMWKWNDRISGSISGWIKHREGCLAELKHVTKTFGENVIVEKYIC